MKKTATDLASLSIGTKAILYLHWKREHVWLTQYKNIDLAEKLLKQSKVLNIIEMHPHRIQGAPKYQNKKCYFSLSNFLFPNFYIKSSYELFYPSRDKKIQITNQTYQYHTVFKPTSKKWKLVNRISIIIKLNDQDLSIRHIPVLQRKDRPKVEKIENVKSKMVRLGIHLISLFYYLPKSIYNLLEELQALLIYEIWNAKVKISIARQLYPAVLLTKPKTKVL